MTPVHIEVLKNAETWESHFEVRTCTNENDFMSMKNLLSNFQFDICECSIIAHLEHHLWKKAWIIHHYWKKLHILKSSVEILEK